MFSGCNVSEQKVWSGKDRQMQARSVSGHYGEIFYTEHNIIINYIPICLVLNYEMRKYYSNSVFLLLSVCTFSAGVCAVCIIS